MSYDVLAVNMETYKVKIMAENKTEKSAEGIERMCILRRGVDTHFYVSVPHGKFKEGDDYLG